MAPGHKPQIMYFACDATMGDLPPDACMAYRHWARETLQHVYPHHQITVVDDVPSLDACWTNDEAALEEIQDFCSRLWDMCPWDWEEKHFAVTQNYCGECGNAVPGYAAFCARHAPPHTSIPGTK